jgi:hypothetical protein
MKREDGEEGTDEQEEHKEDAKATKEPIEAEP